MRVADEDGGRAPRANQSVVVSTKRPLEEPPEKVDGPTLMRLPVDPTYRAVGGVMGSAGAHAARLRAAIGRWR